MATKFPKILKTLQHEVRAERELSTAFGRSGKIPEHIATPEANWLQVGPGIARRIRSLRASLLEDECYEHLADEADAALWEFVCKCAIDRSADHTKAFVKQRSREPRPYTVSFSVDHLTVVGPERIGDVVLLPLPDETTGGGEHLRRDAAAGSMLQVVVTGTSADRATERGRERARHALSLLRVSLANMRMLNVRQLRFRLGELYLVGENIEGFHRHDDVAYGIDFVKSIGETFPDFKHLDIPFVGGTDIQKRLALAVSWIDDSCMDVSPIHRIGFLFTALEAMLGDSAEGLKAPALVFYRTALGHVVRGNFPDPRRLYYLYDQVRSYATHGEVVADVSESDVDHLAWNIRETLLDLVRFCQDRNLISRQQVRQELVKDGVGEQTLNYLRETGLQDWWADWSPGLKSSKSQREQELATKVVDLEAGVAELKCRLAALQGLTIPEGT